MENERFAYEYKGVVKDGFGNVLNESFKALTIAESDKKALNNIAYQYRNKRGFKNNYLIKLDPKSLERLERK